MKIKQKISKLSNAETVALENRREMMEGLILAVPGMEVNFLTRLHLIDQEVTKKACSGASGSDLLGLSIILGDVFVHEMGFHWVMVDDVYGRNFAIRYGDTRITINPRTLISMLVDQEGDMRVDEVYTHASENVRAMLMGDPYVRSIDVPMVHPLLKTKLKTLEKYPSALPFNKSPLTHWFAAQ